MLSKYLLIVLTLGGVGCVQMNSAEPKPSPLTSVEVTTVSLKLNALIYHIEGEAFGYDFATVKVLTPGPLLNSSIEIALPQPGSLSYDRLIAALPARKKMWELLRLPTRRLLIQIDTVELNRYRQAVGDPDRFLPFVEATSIKSVEPVN